MKVVLETRSEGVVLPVRVRAGARRQDVQLGSDGRLKIFVTKPAERGKANQAVIGVLSDLLGVPKFQIELIAGRTSAQKKFLVQGRSPQQTAAAIEQRLAQR